MEFAEAQREQHAEDGRAPIEWKQYLEIAPAMASLDAGARTQLLDANGIDAATWTRGEGYWLLTLALDIQQGHRERIDAYGRACAVMAANKRAVATSAAEPSSPSLPGSTQPSAKLAIAAETGRAGDLGGEPQAAISSALATAAPGFEPKASPPELPTFLRAGQAPTPPGPVSVGYALPRPGVATLRVLETTCDTMPVPRRAALPFGQAPSPEYAARLSSPTPAPAPASRQRPDATMVSASNGADPTLPFGGSRASGDEPTPSLPDLTVDQHAKLSAELALGFEPAQRAEILARYGIESPEALTSLGAEWQSRLKADAAVGERWKSTYARHRAALQQQRGRR